MKNIAYRVPFFTKQEHLLPNKLSLAGDRYDALYPLEINYNSAGISRALRSFRDVHMYYIATADFSGGAGSVTSNGYLMKSYDARDTGYHLSLEYVDNGAFLLGQGYKITFKHLSEEGKVRIAQNLGISEISPGYISFFSLNSSAYARNKRNYTRDFSVWFLAGDFYILGSFIDQIAPDDKLIGFFKRRVNVTNRTSYHQSHQKFLYGKNINPLFKYRFTPYSYIVPYAFTFFYSLNNPKKSRDFGIPSYKLNLNYTFIIGNTNHYTEAVDPNSTVLIRDLGATFGVTSNGGGTMYPIQKTSDIFFTNENLNHYTLEQKLDGSADSKRNQGVSKISFSRSDFYIYGFLKSNRKKEAGWSDLRTQMTFEGVGAVRFIRSSGEEYTFEPSINSYSNGGSFVNLPDGIKLSINPDNIPLGDYYVYIDFYRPIGIYDPTAKYQYNIDQSRFLYTYKHWQRVSFI